MRGGADSGNACGLTRSKARALTKIALGAAYTSDLQKMGGMPGTNTQTRTPWWNG
jgi:hypothetical protein